MRQVRVGDRVYMTYHMSNRGVVTEVIYRPVTAGTGAGSFSTEMWIKVESELTGEIVEVKSQDVTKEWWKF